MTSSPWRCVAIQDGEDPRAGSARLRNGSRRERFGAVVALVLLIAACGGPARTTPVTAGRVQTGTIQVDGIARDYRVYLPPPSGAARQVPLLLALHGGQQYGDDMEQLTDFDALARAGGFIVAYPNGHGRTWNAGTCCGRPDVTTDDEVDFIDALITRLAAAHPVDLSRVYVTGLSAGAAMTYTTACRLAQRVTAIASVAGTMDLASCHPQRPVSVMEIHGTADLELLYGGGVFTGVGDAVTPSTTDIMTTWASLDSCPGSPSTSTEGRVTVMRWRGCADGTSVVLETVAGGGHNWYSPLLTGADGSLDASQVIWQFLSTQRRP